MYHLANELLTIGQVAAQLGVSPRTVETLTRRGELRRVTINSRCVRYAQRDVSAYLESRKE